MQQFRTQSKNENKNTSNIAQMMAQMDKKKRVEKIPEEYFELLKKPRSKKYLQLVAEQIQLSADMENVAVQIRQLEDALEETEEGVGDSQSKEWWEEEKIPVETTGEESDWTRESVDLTEITERAKQKKKELQAKKEELEREYQELAQKLEESKKELERELPVGDGRLGMIYPSCYEQKLLDYGVIAVPGSPYFSQKDLLDQVKPKSKQEEKQWCKGNEYYHLHVYERKENVLLIEIYMFAICVVYEQGTTVLYRDDN
ncbi:MAG: hypothetical protein PUB54_05995 [Lachnospiraceae bacterium]|nr:hypothetical protein [Lachnospiraceae bacterium]